MPPSPTLTARHRTGPSIPVAWKRALGLLGLGWGVLVALCFRDWSDMIAQWWGISTYNHILLVPAILAWLVAMRRRELLQLSPQGWWPGLVWVAGACLLWVLGSFAGLSLARQLGAVAMLQGACLALLGPRVAAAMAFPLGYMLFLVPAGEELVPWLQLLTARMAMVLLGTSGIPAFIEGVFITTPAGAFKVAEACSGIKFLVAMSAFAVLAANLCFRAWPRRMVFVLAAMATAVLANGVRAWGTIAIAEWRGIEFASGFDHIFYGWIFFALVIALVLAVGWRWFDRAPDELQVDVAAIGRSRVLGLALRASLRDSVALAAIAVLAALSLAWASAGARVAAPVPARIELPQVPGWHRVDYEPAVWWQPLQGGADHRLLGRYEDASGNRIEVSLAVWASQGEGREAGGFGQGAVPRGADWAWEQPEESLAGGRAELIAAPGPVERLAVTWYRTGNVTTGSNLRLKLANIVDKLALRAHPTTALIVSAEQRPGHPARIAVERFVAATGEPGAWMDRVSANR